MTTHRVDGGGSARAEDFVRRFAAYWSAPDPSMLEHLLTDDVRLVQPLSATTEGLAAAQESFRRLFARFPSQKPANSIGR